MKEQAESEIWRADGSEVEDVLTHKQDGAHASGGRSRVTFLDATKKGIHVGRNP